MIGRAHGQAGQELKYRRQKEHVEIFASHSDLSLSLNVLHIDHRSISCLRNLSRCLRLTSNPERRVRTENEILRSNSRYTISGKWSTFFFQWSTVMLIRNQKSQIESERLIKGKKRGGGIKKGKLRKLWISTYLRYLPSTISGNPDLALRQLFFFCFQPLHETGPTCKVPCCRQLHGMRGPF